MGPEETQNEGKIDRSLINTLRPRQNGRHFADDTFKLIFVNENVRISIKISPKFVPYGPINHIPALVQIMAWRRPGDKTLSETMMVSSATHICVTRPRWVNWVKLWKNIAMGNSNSQKITLPLHKRCKSDAFMMCSDRETRVWVARYGRWRANESLLPGSWFNIKRVSYQCRKPHCADETVVRSSGPDSRNDPITVIKWSDQ